MRHPRNPACSRQHPTCRLTCGSSQDHPPALLLAAPQESYTKQQLVHTYTNHTSLPPYYLLDKPSWPTTATLSLSKSRGWRGKSEGTACPVQPIRGMWGTKWYHFTPPCITVVPNIHHHLPTVRTLVSCKVTPTTLSAPRRHTTTNMHITMPICRGDPQCGIHNAVHMSDTDAFTRMQPRHSLPHYTH